MSHFLKDYLQQELKQVRWLLTREFKVDYNTVSNLISLNDTVFDHIGPLLILAFSKSHANSKKGYILATAVYFILLGHDIHQHQDKDLTLNVLFGDYFYTKFFDYLYKYDLLRWANDFSNIICQLQESAIIKSQNAYSNLAPIKLEEVIDKDYANICELCSYIGGTLIQLDETMLVKLKHFGKNVGRSIYLANLQIETNLALEYLFKASRELATINGFIPKKIMLTLLEQIKSKLEKLKIEVAV